MRADGHTWLYAIGDINGKALFTHMGKYQARIACDHILGKETAISHGADGPLSPRVIFTEPQVAAVGHTTDTAAEAGLVVETVETSTSGNAGGSFYGRGAPGTARLLIDRERGLVVGATITGAEVADMLHAATIAIVGDIPLERLRHAVPCFPTRSEIWLQLLEQAGV
jgi:dihydrolipoamide dehydrogenase